MKVVSDSCYTVETANKLISAEYKLSESDLFITLFIIRKEEIDDIMDRYKTCCLNYDEDCKFIKCSDCCLLGMFGFCLHFPVEKAVHIYIRKVSHYLDRSRDLIGNTIKSITHETLHGVMCHIGEEDASRKYDLMRTRKDETFDYKRAFELEKKLPKNIVKE